MTTMITQTCTWTALAHSAEAPDAAARGRMTMDTDTLTYCPACQQPAALIPLGVRRDRPYRWRCWITTLTQLYLCAHCDALVQVRANGNRLVQTANEERLVQAVNGERLVQAVSGSASRGAPEPVPQPQTETCSEPIPPARIIWPAAA